METRNDEVNEPDGGRLRESTDIGAAPMPSPDVIREFRQVVEEECGVTMSTQEAWNRYHEIIALLQLLASAE